MGQMDTASLLLQRKANPFLVVTRGIHKGRLAIDLSNSRSLELNKMLADAMMNRCEAQSLQGSLCPSHPTAFRF